MTSFKQRALDLFSFQYQHNALYKAYCDLLHIDPQKVRELTQIPFLPISFFRSEEVKTTDFMPAKVFLSSGTSSSLASKHFIKDELAYLDNTIRCFNYFYKNVTDYTFLFLLPSYLEREGSSLVYMAKHFATQSRYKAHCGFFLHDFESLAKRLSIQESEGIPTMLFGVTYALMDFATLYDLNLSHTLVIETGGMKGKREELIRGEVHTFLKQRWQLKEVHSEYGMTELMSQAYALREGLFNTHPDLMRVCVRPLDNPLVSNPYGKGALNIIDLGNQYSCAFIATEDVGEVYEDGAFRVEGRMDSALLRGCNQLWS